MNGEKYWILELNVYGDMATLQSVEEKVMSVMDEYCTCNNPETDMCSSPIVGLARYPADDMNEASS